MEELHFRIAIVPEEKYITDKEIEARNQYYSVLCKNLLEVCGLRDVSLSILKVKKKDDDDYPEVEGLVYQCEAKFLILSARRNVRECYKMLCSEWKKIMKPSPSPMLVLHESSSFSNMRNHHICVDIKNFSFGVLPHNGKFYTTLNSQAFQNMDLIFLVTVDFQHDLRQFKIQFGGMELISHYNKIKNVFVNIDSNPREVFFELCDPPIGFKVEKRTNRYTHYTISHRTSLVNDYPTFGRSNVLKFTFKNADEADEIIDRIHFRCGRKPIHYGVIETTEKFFTKDPDCDLDHFGCTYLMTALLRRNFTMAAQATNIHHQISELKKLCRENPECLEKALTLVLAALDSGAIVNFWDAVEKQYHYYLSNRDEIDYQHYVVPEKTKVIRRVTITPTRHLLWAPEIMLSNRVLRNFDSDFSLRASFRDDDNSRLSFHAKFATEEIFGNAIRTPMGQGIEIGNRLYEFLAWSNSQIRDHGVWMYAKDGQGRTVRDIRTWMGDFSHIRSVPKYMARMGQCFSQTEDAVAVPLNDAHVRIEDDVEGGLDAFGNRYCFSDGVGKISVKLAKEVHKALGHDQHCSAFQIRYGGCKGMLVIDTTLKDVDIVFRKSMVKFQSPKNDRLEIAKTSSPISLQLNRPFITILNDMGVRHRTFLKLQEKVLQNLTDMLFEEKNASEFLSSKTPSELFSYKDLSHSGVHLTTEPFFRSLLLALHRHHVEKVKSKTNIPIDPCDGRNMLGVMDETGLLNYGEVFVQYTKDLQYGETTSDTEIRTGTVLITKNPCHLPGDVRKFNAVDIPQLHHIVDCIVFPQKGKRPHPNEMAGSDLDGDEYAVLWNPDLIFYCENKPPGDFPSAREQYKTYINEGDMIEFLVQYIKNDQVGTIANSHLAHADNHGIFSTVCIKIAKKFSYAVDFAKTGYSEHLDPSERPEKHPDFMEKNYKENYQSQKALGKMYRIAKDYESENEYASHSYDDIKVDPELQYPGWEKYRDDAIRSRNKFNTLLKTVLRNYGIQHESEVFSSAFTKLHCRFQERKDRDEIEKVVVRTIKRLSKSMYEEEFLEEFNAMGNVKQMTEGMFQKASAWYIVTYSDKNAKFLSFPWTVSKILANVKVKRGKGSISPGISPIIHNFNDRIQYCVAKSLLPFPTDNTKELSECHYVCNRSIVEHALRVLLLWAEDEEIIERSGQTRGFLFQSVFIKLFLYVSEKAGYVSPKTNPLTADKSKHYSAAALCVEFFKFCLTLRFYSKHIVHEVLPFNVYEYKKLSKQAVVAYHRFAVLGKFSNLYFDTEREENRIEMKPIQIDSKIFLITPISKMDIGRAENALMKLTSVEEVRLREVRQTKKVIVSAAGTDHSLVALKDLLRKKHVVLRHVFQHGQLPP